MRNLCFCLILMLCTISTWDPHAFAESPQSQSTNQIANQDPNASNAETNAYRSGRLRPSPGLHQNPVRETPAPMSPPTAAYPGRTGGFLSHFGAFGAGALLGSLFHPFGGAYGGYGYGYGYPSFSIVGFVIDVILIVLVFSLIRKLFQRRY